MPPPEQDLGDDFEDDIDDRGYPPASGQNAARHSPQDFLQSGASTMSMPHSNAISGAVGLPHPTGLDLSFGYTPLQFEKINLLGSGLSEQAISSLVLSVPNITYLDLRGNNLNAAFGWRLVKAMRKRYLQLEYCNGVHLKALRDNLTDTLNLASFSGPMASSMGMYGIEVVGAIFLAHFLRLNNSLTYLNFRRNDVQKDGAKALAQSMLGNPQCNLRTVNTMGPPMCPDGKRGGRGGIDFGHFRTSQLTTVNLSKRLLDDDDFVFLEEWLRRYDCVTDLDISHNLMCRDGIRKLTRHIKETKMLRKLTCHGLPVDLEGTALLARAVVENETLEQVTLPLGPCDENAERQQMLQQLGVGIARHPTLKLFGQGPCKLEEIRENRVREMRSERLVNNMPRGDAAVYMWFLAAIKPGLEKLQFGPGGRPTKDYPQLVGSPPELWPGLIGIVYDVNRSLMDIRITVPKGYGPLAMELMRALTRCSVLRILQLNGYASGVLREQALPAEWASLGGAPRWLLEERVKKIKVHWQALHGLLGTLPHLESFNDIELGGNLRDSPEKTVQLLLQCLVGVAADFDPTKRGYGDEPVMVANLKKEADVDAFCDVLRLLNRTPIELHLTCSDKRMEVVKAQQLRLAAPLSGVPAGEAPRFTHAVCLKNSVISEALLQSVDCSAQLREFGYERIDSILKGLFTALCGRERPLPVVKINIEPKWHKEGLLVKKRFGDQQRRWLDSVHAALVRSDRFQGFESLHHSTVARDMVESMSPEEFAALMSGWIVSDIPRSDLFPSLSLWRAYTSYRSYVEQDTDAMYVPLPMGEEAKNELQLTKLSLCMCNLRPKLAKTARPDEWYEHSRLLWRGAGKFIRTGDWNENDPISPEADEAADQEGADAEQPPRYHWRDNIKLGTRQVKDMINDAKDPDDMPFVDELVQESLRSIFVGNESIKWLDVRGNGLTKEDADLLLELVEAEDQILAYLNMIPVTGEGAGACRSLVMDGTSMDKGNTGPREDVDDDPFGDGGGAENTGELWAQEAIANDFVRLDEGDGFIFLSLVSPKYFPELHSVVIRKHEIPDTTLPHITDALLNLASIQQLQLSHLRLTGRGAALLLSAVAEMAPRLTNLNGLPLAHLVQLRDKGDSRPLELNADIEWNDFSLGCMARLNLWAIASFPHAPADGGANFHLDGQSLTDVGLRGLCAMLRHFAVQERSSGLGSAPKPAATLSLLKIDLSGNAQITDATVADLCHTLQQPTLGASLRHTLQELNLRSCSRLRTRSGYELLGLVHHVRDAVRDTGNPAAFGSSLKMLNGIDVHSLVATSRAPGVGGRSGAPPMLLRTLADLGHPRLKKAQLPHMSECDVAFFASMLHLFSQIPYCHVHIVIPKVSNKSGSSDDLPPWGSRALNDDSSEGTGVADDRHKACSNESPFPPPATMQSEAIAAVQSQFEAARKLFESCPISTQLRVSAAPLIEGCEDLISQGDQSVLIPITGGDKGGAAASSFGRVQQRLRDQAAKKRKKLNRDAPPKRPLYVNNINSQQLHDCFRTLYGQDDLDLEHDDVIASDGRNAVRLASEIDISQLFAIATSVDLQHLDLCPAHVAKLQQVSDMPVLTHINLNHNHLGDSGVEYLFTALSQAACTVVHISVSDNNIGDAGAQAIASNLPNLTRLTSLQLCENFIQERGSIALAESIGGMASHEDDAGEDVIQTGPLQVLSVDLRGNHSRELGALRWAEVVAPHPSLQFLCLANNELGRLSSVSFTGLIYAACASASLSVLDLRDNFPLGPNQPSTGPPPQDMIQGLLGELPAGEFDAAEVRQGVFIRRHRGGGGGAEKKGRQPQQGQRPANNNSTSQRGGEN
eukprot:TRINITY_DN91032_c0_g1_i1.p1 TRINITY_DN91032_c0_g1~~TRINITY_DN91032_c0_g1_i1.p1  ORF type:complete len:1888 (-),score=482.22 TRINITY_DN91032_c0_g1_i1:66-5597(-)